MLEEDAEIGILALERGLVPQEALNDCLTQVSENGRSLVELFKEKNLLSLPQIEQLRAEAAKRLRDRHHDATLGSLAQEAAAPPSEDDAETQSMFPAEVARAAREASNLFGKFIRTELLGKGTLGPVYKAWDIDEKRWVALRILRDSGDGVEMLLLEAQSHRDLRHPGIVSVLETGRQIEEGVTRAYIAMDLVEGEPLDQARARGLGPLQAAEMVRDAARAVHHAHHEGVIHKDLKPRNIFLSSDRRVLVSDFGLAAVAATLGPSEDSMLSRTIQVAGTPEYMSPEQALGRTSDIKERSDVYQLGATLYFLLTGRPPFSAGTAMKTCFAVVREPLQMPSQFNPEVNADLERIVVRAMAKDPVRRYESAQAFADELDRVLAGRAVLSDDQLRLTQGIAALHAGRLEEAIHMFKELLRLESAGRLGQKGPMQQLQEGEDGLTLAIKQQQKNYDIRTQRGVYRFAKAILQSLEGADPSGSCKSSLDDFVVSAELRPEYTPARVNRANVLIFGGRYARDTGKDVSPVFEMALKDLDAAIEFDSTCSPAYHNRGIVNFYIARSLRKGQGDPEPYYRKAIDDFSRAAELEQTYAYVFKDLGVVKVALAKHQLAQGVKVKSLFIEAIHHLDIAIQLNSTIYGAYYERGQAHFAVKDFKAAIRDFKRCLELDATRDKKVQALIDEAQRHLDTRRI
ncbi:MAG TPA: protein kinase [Planctomycetota bacterium]|nr:protein kinase [Planctomycetota bacterium]